MKNIAAQLESYCKEYPIRLTDRETILETLYWLYAENPPTDCKELREGYAKLREQLNFLESNEYDAVFDIVSDLCTKSEQLAFYAGARIGAALMMELADEPLG